ncbi:pilus assembly protein [Yersinia alsatica]|uniref:Pilus assembly protein n=1 Tax=Yersinia alsatica TaxID=2890317 RepID=A0ABY5UUK9_9GAMM|nr:TadE/TadG family type IV pilus assembly protein [Yersinia alsatica]OWF69879.1 tight adherance operon protein [Yersinia frederiksenii]UWM46420.1 pilus assembly protein [Yersinia alsatica]CNK50494.1 putative tight adherance operon protein [Yersinia frederiksenii]CNL30680.1 putative tight adherance operon protein [Yersinia frederiksenii]
MSKITHSFIHSRKGSITIEFIIVFFLFIVMLLFSAEITRLFYTSASLDLAISEAVKSAKNKQRNDSDSYNTILKKRLLSQQGVLGTFITDDNSVKTSVIFSLSIDDIINNNMSGDNKSPLAKYTVSYLYRPVFFPIPSIWANSLLLREVIFAQEI